MSKAKSYEEFVEKFKPKKTTDDCYTPAIVYEAIKNWAVNHYKWQGREIVRPFYPGGDYEQYEYPQNCVVIDNPPFSIISKIVKWYAEHEIEFFLFAPHLTLFNSGRYAKSNIAVGANITYENGAVVKTSFLCSKGPKIMSSPELYEIVEAANRQNLKEANTPQHPKYTYPDNVMTSNKVSAFSKYGVKYEEDTGVFVRRLDSQIKHHKAIFGAGFIVPELNARRAQEEYRRAQEEHSFKWELSPREMQLLREAESLEERREP